MNALHRKLTLTEDQEDKVELNKLNASIKELYIKLKREAWSGLCSNIDAKTPNTKLWKLAQSLSYNQPQNMPCNTVLTSDGKAAPDDKTAANVLGEFYKGVGNLKFNQNDVILKNRSKRMIHNCRTSSSGNHIFINKFTLRELNFALRAMDLRKSPGPDGIHGFMIGHLGPHGMQKLLDIFNFSWKIGRLPHDWKRAIIIPILKPGKDISTSASYRPIALTPFVCKLMERLVLARLIVHLNINSLLPSEQYGYRKGHGAVDQILYFCQRIRDAQNKKPTNHTVAALLDMSGAFDRVWRQLLITKLYDYFRTRGRALPWISNFLWDRSIRVKYNNYLSDPFAIRQGVPQRSVLNPALFSLYITGIEKVLAKHCEVGIFADDIIVWSSGSDVGENELKLNRTMEEAHSFAEMHKLIFNTSKSLTTFFSTNRHLFNNQPKISMNGILFCYDIELTFLCCGTYSLSFTGAGLELDGIYFHDQLLTSVTKSSEIPALVNQLALETINGISQSSLKICTDGSRGEKGISGSGVYIPTPSGALEFKIKNPNYCSVFRSELIAIRRGLQCAAQLEDRFQEIWILTDSRASIQHFTNWGDIGDQTRRDILSLLRDLSSGHSIHFQWIPSHVGIVGNERADFLAKTAAVEGVSPRGNLTFSEISTISKLELNRQIKTPPSHAWYFAKCPGESFRLSSRPLQSAYSRFLSGHKSSQVL
ncbi:RNA-directed DNA polymerase from mobile element jockey [Trichonephila clavipes]|nr:RNA-directed DNA polymerase from mobile element jockey [Trichonephila clavipes]